MNVFRRLAGPGKDALWSELGREIGAEFQPGGFFKESALILARDGWRIVLDTHRVHTGKSQAVYTRLRAPFSNPGGFRFRIFRRNILSGIAARLGMQDLEIGDSSFDDPFILQSNDGERLRRLLLNSEIRSRLEREPAARLAIAADEGLLRKNLPAGVDELSFRALGILTDKERLKNLFELFFAVLEQLRRMDAADPSDPLP
jgi:hypothetical protein